MKKVGIIGFGNMGSAIAEQLKEKFQIFVFDKDAAKLNSAQGNTVASSAADLVCKVETVILAIKPQDFAGLLSEIKSSIQGKLVITIAAGISTTLIEKTLDRARVVRVMPNMPAKIGMGMSCLCKGAWASDEDLYFAKGLFDALGKTLIIKEGMMDAATAISGSGPGFFFDLVQGKKIDEEEASGFTVLLTSAAQVVGFSKEQSILLSSTTTAGSVALLAAEKISPAELVKQVASKGGTTEAGLKVLHNGGSLEDAVRAAKKRAEELSRKG